MSETDCANDWVSEASHRVQAFLWTLSKMVFNDITEKGPQRSLKLFTLPAQ